MEYIVVHVMDESITTLLIFADSGELAYSKYVDYITTLMGWCESLIHDSHEDGMIRIIPLDRLTMIE